MKSKRRAYVLRERARRAFERAVREALLRELRSMRTDGGGMGVVAELIASRVPTRVEWNEHDLHHAMQEWRRACRLLERTVRGWAGVPPTNMREVRK